MEQVKKVGVEGIEISIHLLGLRYLEHELQTLMLKKLCCRRPHGGLS
jgi:hypothetical protein